MIANVKEINNNNNNDNNNNNVLPYVLCVRESVSGGETMHGMGTQILTVHLSLVTLATKNHLFKMDMSLYSVKV